MNFVSIPIQFYCPSQVKNNFQNKKMERKPQSQIMYFYEVSAFQTVDQTLAKQYKQYKDLI